MNERHTQFRTHRPRVNPAPFATLAVLSLCLCTDLGAMIYRPEQGAMWDPSIVWHNGKFHAFMMYAKQGRNGLEAGHCLLATSTDGVHWRTEGVVNEERELAAGNKFFKCFVGRCGDRFIMDHGVARPRGQDLMRWYESTDLRQWNYLFSSSPDPRWYGVPPQPARWDHMYILPKEEGNPAAGFWGHVVAVPKPGDPPGVGMMESADGRAWTVLPPAPMLWPEGVAGCNHFEYGGCERIGGKYYLIGGLVLQRLCAFSTTPPQFSATSCLMAFLGDAITLHSPIAPFSDFVLVPLTQIE